MVVDEEAEHVPLDYASADPSAEVGPGWFAPNGLGLLSVVSPIVAVACFPLLLPAVLHSEGTSWSMLYDLLLPIALLSPFGGLVFGIVGWRMRPRTFVPKLGVLLCSIYVALFVCNLLWGQ